VKDDIFSLHLSSDKMSSYHPIHQPYLMPERQALRIADQRIIEATGGPFGMDGGEVTCPGSAPPRLADFLVKEPYQLLVAMLLHPLAKTAVNFFGIHLSNFKIIKQ
jgi:hypothetical protein